MEHSKSYFPVQPSSTLTTHSNTIDGDPTGYANEIVGGVSKRFEVSLRLFTAMLANPTLRAATIDQLRGLSIEHADKFIAELGDT